LCDSRIDVLLRLIQRVRFVCELGVVRVVEYHLIATIGSIVVQPAILATPILMSEHLSENQNGHSKTNGVTYVVAERGSVVRVLPLLLQVGRKRIIGNRDNMPA
jgi:hypothetical protein